MDLCVWTKENISAYADGELEAAEKRSVSEHISCCASCALQLEQTAQLARACSSALEEDAPGLYAAILAEVAADRETAQLAHLYSYAEELPPADLRQRIAAATYARRSRPAPALRRWLKPLAASASACAVAAAVLVLIGEQQQPVQTPSQTAARPAATAPAPAASTQPAVPQSRAELAVSVPSRHASLKTSYRRSHSAALPANGSSLHASVKPLPVPVSKPADRPTAAPDPLPEIVLRPEADYDAATSTPEPPSEKAVPIRIVDARPAEEFIRNSRLDTLNDDLQERIRQRNRSGAAGRAGELTDIKVVEVKLIRAEF